MPTPRFIFLHHALALAPEVYAMCETLPSALGAPLHGSFTAPITDMLGALFIDDVGVDFANPAEWKRALNSETGRTVGHMRRSVLAAVNHDLPELLGRLAASFWIPVAHTGNVLLRDAHNRQWIDGFVESLDADEYVTLGLFPADGVSPHSVGNTAPIVMVRTRWEQIPGSKHVVILDDPKDPVASVREIVAVWEKLK